METRQRILEKARESFMVYGIKGVTMSDIARELGISKKTIYQFFEDKDALVLACTEFQLAYEEDMMTRAKETAADTMDEIFKISEHIRFFTRKMNPSLLQDLKKFYPQAWRIFEQHKHTCMQGHLAISLQRGIEQGYFREDIDIEILARMRIEQVEMAFNTVLFPPEQFPLEKVQITFFEHFILGICTPKGYETFQHLKQKQKLLAK